MGRLDRYLLAQLLTLFGFFALILVLVYWINRAVRLFDQLIADGQSFSVFLVFTALTLPNVIRVVMPVAAFAATLYVVNRMTAESELVIARSTGVSNLRMARPVFVFGVLVMLMMSALTHILVPASMRQFDARQAEVSENVTARLLSEGVFQHPAPGLTFYLRRITPEGELEDVFLSDSRDPNVEITYSSKTAFLVRSDTGPKLAMIEGLAQRLDTQTQSLSTTSFNDFVFDLGVFAFGARAPVLTERVLTTPELLWPSPALRRQVVASPEQIQRELHDRTAKPLSAVAFVMLGFATLMMAGFSRFGIWQQIILAIVLLAVLQTLVGVAEDAVVQAPALWPLWYGPSLLGLLGAVGMLAWSGRTHRQREVSA